MDQDGWHVDVSGDGPEFAGRRSCARGAGGVLRGGLVSVVERELSSWTKLLELVSRTREKSVVPSR